MLKNNSNIIVLLFSLFSGYIFAQDTLQETIRLRQDQLVSGESYEIDTIIDGQTYFKKTIKAVSGTIPEQLLDNDYAAQIDKKWLEELYSNTLFDTIYRDVTDLKYTAVYYPELPTDTLKARLKRLNAKTPFM